MTVSTIYIGRALKDALASDISLNDYDFCLSKDNTLEVKEHYRWGLLNRIRRWWGSSFDFATILEKLGSENFRLEDDANAERLCARLGEKAEKYHEYGRSRPRLGMKRVSAIFQKLLPPPPEPEPVRPPVKEERLSLPKQDLRVKSARPPEQAPLPVPVKEARTPSVSAEPAARPDKAQKSSPPSPKTPGGQGASQALFVDTPGADVVSGRRGRFTWSFRG